MVRCMMQMRRLEGPFATMWVDSRWLDVGHFFLFSSTAYGYENHQVLGCSSFDLKSLEYVAPRVKTVGEYPCSSH